MINEIDIVGKRKRKVIVLRISVKLITHTHTIVNRLTKIRITSIFTHIYTFLHLFQLLVVTLFRNLYSNKIKINVSKRLSYFFLPSLIEILIIFFIFAFAFQVQEGAIPYTEESTTTTCKLGCQAEGFR